MIVLTRVKVWGCHGDHAGAHGHVLEHLVAVAERVEQRRVVVEVQDVEVDREGGRQTGTTGVLSLHHEDVVLHL